MDLKCSLHITICVANALVLSDFYNLWYLAVEYFKYTNVLVCWHCPCSLGLTASSGSLVYFRTVWGPGALPLSFGSIWT